MATEETIILKTEVDTTASDNSIKGLNAQLKDLKLQLASLDEGSDAFKAAAAKAGQLREQIRGVNDAIENADPEKKFAPFTRTVQGLAGGFAAAQGAMALFGGESKALEQTLLKVQGAMALSQGLNSLIEFKNDFKDLGKIIINNVVTAFSTLKGAMIATGIGAFTVAIGFLASKFIEVSEKNEQARKAEEDYKKETELAKKAVDDKVKSLNLEILAIKEKTNLAGATLIQAKAEKFAIEQQIKLAEEHNKLQKEAYTTAEVGGKTITISNMIETESLKKKLAEKNREIEGLELISKKTNELTKIQEQAAKDKELKDNNEKLRVDKINQDAKDEQERKNKEQEDIAKKIDEERAKQNQADEDELKRKRGRNSSIILSNQERYASERADIKSMAEDETLSYNERVSAYQNMLNAQEISTKEYNDAIDKLDQAQLESKLALYSAIGQGLGSLSQLAGQETEAGKALAIAQATIDTYAGATREFGKGGILGFITGAAVIAAGLANVQRIVSVKIPKSSGGGSSSPSISGPIAPPIISRTIPSEGGTIGNEGGGKTTEPKPLRVVVLASDITNTQNDIKTNVERSTIK